MSCNLNLSREDIGDLYNCVMLIVSERERNNMVSDMFEDAPKADPIIERLYALEQRLLNHIDTISHADGVKGPEYSTENPWKGISMPPPGESFSV